MPDKAPDMPTVRELVTSLVLGARTQEELDRAVVLLREWRAVYPDDWATLRLGEQVHKMRGAQEAARA